MMAGYGARTNTLYNKLRRITVLVACAGLFATFCAADWHDALRSLPEKAEQAYKQKNYKKALQLYQEAQTRNPDSDTLAYNLGNTLYKLGKFQDAAKQYGKILGKDSAAIAPQAIYNMGNSLFKMGQESKNQEFLQKALEAYKHSIISNPKDEDSKYNYELTRRLIKKQEQQQKQQQQNKDNKDKNKDKKQDQQQAKNQKDKNQKDKQQQQQAQKDKEKQKQQQAQQAQAQKADQQKKKEEQQPKPGEMSKQEADKILQALVQMEKEAREQENQKKKQQQASSSKGPDW